MAPTKVGGRPRNAWTASRSRKLTRLYLMTDIKISEIQDVLRGVDFYPSTRNIQMQLKVLLPDNKENWREYRPDDILHGRQQFGQVKLCKEYQIKKHSRRRPASQITAKALRPGSPLGTLDTGASPYYNPSRHYECFSSSISAAHTTLLQPDGSSGQIGLLSKDQSPEVPRIDIYSDKEVVPNEEHVLPTESISSGCSTSHSRANSSETRPIVDELSSGSEPVEGASVTPTEAKSLPYESSTLKRSHSKVSSIGSMRSFSSRVSSKLSLSLSFVNSVISTDSWRSSLVYSMSMSSGRVSNISDLPWSSEEMESWNELVDESLLAKNSTSPTRREANLLQYRPCCSFFEKDSLQENRSLCHICGFSFTHYEARSWCCLGGSQRSWAEVDRFGNTSLHHAAAAGNVLNVIDLLNHIRKLEKHPADSYLNHRNTAGETFLHVIQIKDSNYHQELVDILKEASFLGFNFDTVDHKGRRINLSIEDLLHGCKIYPSTIPDVADLLGVEHSSIEQAVASPWDTTSSSGHSSGNFLQNIKGDPSLLETYSKKPKWATLGILKNALGYSWLKRSKLFHNHVDDFDGNGDTKLISSLKKWETDPLSRTPLERLIKKSDIEMRDRRGYTALAIAAGEGIRNAVFSLLKQGANPNSRSYRGTSVMAYAGRKLAQAQKRDRGDLYSRILACMVLLNDNGAKSIVNLYEEYTMPTHLLEGKRKSVRTTLSKSQLSSPLDTIEEDISDMDETDTPKIAELASQPVFQMDVDRDICELDAQAALVELPSSSERPLRNFEKVFQDSEVPLKEPEGIVCDGEKAFNITLDTSLDFLGQKSRFSNFDTSLSSLEPSSCTASTDKDWLSNFEKFFQDSDVICWEPDEMTAEDDKAFSSMLGISPAMWGQTSRLSTFQTSISSWNPSSCAISTDNSWPSNLEKSSSTFFGAGPSTFAPSHQASRDITLGTSDSPHSLPVSNSHFLGYNTGYKSAVAICPINPVSGSYVSDGIENRAGHNFASNCNCGVAPGSPQTKAVPYRKIKSNNGIPRNNRKRLEPLREKEILNFESVPRCSPISTAEDKWPPDLDLNKPQPTPSGCSKCKFSTSIEQCDCTVTARNHPGTVSPHQTNMGIEMEQLRHSDILENENNISENFKKHDFHDMRHHHPTKRRRIEPRFLVHPALESSFATTRTSLNNSSENEPYRSPDEAFSNRDQLYRTDHENTGNDIISPLILGLHRALEPLDLPDRNVSVQPNELDDTTTTNDPADGWTTNAGPYQNWFEAAY